MLPYERTHPDRAVVLDWDGVFFNSAQLVECRTEQLEKQLGISEWISLESYKAAKESEENEGGTVMEHFCQEMHEHLSRFSGEDPASAPQALTAREIMDFLTATISRDAHRFVYDDARKFCQQMEKFRDLVDFYILTQSYKPYQEAKIAASGLAGFFKGGNPAAEPMRSRILITRDEKGPYIYELSKHYDSVLFLDDKAGQLVSVRQFMKRMGKNDYPLYCGLVYRGQEPRQMPDLAHFRLNGLKSLPDVLEAGFLNWKGPRKT